MSDFVLVGPADEVRAFGGSAVVGLVMGSDSDWPVMEEAARVLEEFGIGYEADVVSAHRMPQETFEYGQGAVDRGLRVIIAGAGAPPPCRGCWRRSPRCRSSASRCR